MSEDRRVVVGVGLSSRATATEVRDLVGAALRAHRLALDDVQAIATRASLAGDPRLQLGLPVVGVADDVLVDRSEPPERSVGIPARVAETAALVTGGAEELLEPVRRSAGVTVALVLAARTVDGDAVTVYLVGAGPGDPGLLTVRAAELLARADVLVHDRLVDRLRRSSWHRRIACASTWASGPATQACPRTRSTGCSSSTAAPAARSCGSRAVIPTCSGAAVRRRKRCRPRVSRYEVVPGVSSAVAAPAAAGIPVTMRGHAGAFTVVTGHEDPAGDTSIDWEAHAATGATLVVMMGAGRMALIAKRLMAGGLPPDTPVTAVHWGCTERQAVIRTRLDEVGDHDLSAPSTVVIGDVAGLDLRSH